MHFEINVLAKPRYDFTHVRNGDVFASTTSCDHDDSIGFFSALEKEHNDYWFCKGFIYVKRRKIYQSFTFLSLTVPTATNRFTVMFATCVWTNDLKGNISAGPIPDTTSVVYV